MDVKIFQDEAGSWRHPAISQLEAEIIAKQPANVFLFIKQWAKRKLKEARESGSDQDFNPVPPRTLKSKRRNAILMVSCDKPLQDSLPQRDCLPKNQECKSRVMLRLRSMPFLQGLSWEDINDLVGLARLHEYHRNEIIVQKRSIMSHVFIIVDGEVQIRGDQGLHRFSCGDCLSEQVVINPVTAKADYEVTSARALVCCLEAFSIYEYSVGATKRRYGAYETIIMGISFFSNFDPQERSKLLSMVRQCHFRPDETIVEKNSVVSRVYMVLVGAVLKCKKNLGGQIVSFKTITAGEYFGEEWLMETQAEAEYAVIAKGDCTLGSIDRREIENGIAKIAKLKERRQQRENS